MAEFLNLPNKEGQDNQNQILQQIANTLGVTTDALSSAVNLANQSATNAENKIVDVENRFQTLTTEQQQDAEVVDARQGKTSLVANIQEFKDEFAAHKAESATDIVHGMGGSVSDLSDTGTISTPHKAQVNASDSSSASGTRSQVNASNTSSVSGSYSQINASNTSSVSGSCSQINASGVESSVSGSYSQVNASNGSVVDGDLSSIIASGRRSYGQNRGCKIPLDVRNAVILSSFNVENDERNSVAGGYNNTIDYPSTNNRKWHIFSITGDIQHSGTISSGHAFTDFAELFPNLTGEKQGFGLLQTLDGYGVRPANDGEDVIGVTSATAGIILGDTPFSWQGRWLKNEWGEYIMEEVEIDGEIINQPKENPEWNPELEQKSRLERPDEWTVVGLLGQVYVRLKEDVQPMDYVKAWQNGIGQKSLEPTNLQVMKITQEYDAEKGYKIGFCLLR